MTTLALIGESWGENEAKERLPFVGASGYMLTQMLEEAGIARADCFLTNVFNMHPPGNRIEAFCGPKAEGIKGRTALIKSKYVRAEFEPELDRLAEELVEVRPNLVVLLGNTPCWALLNKTAITKLRGTTSLSTHIVTDFKVLPTFHPSAVLRQWELRPIVIADLMKAAREREYPDIRRPKRQIWIEPTLEDIYAFREQNIRTAKTLSVDIETAGRQITCIGFATSPSIGIVIPFLDTRRMDRCYWPTIQAERSAWQAVKEILEDPKPPKLFQNGLYDIPFLWRSYGIKTYGAEEDTMLLQHALQPESLKGLGFLGSIYSDEASWKQMRQKVETIKRDD